MNLLTQLDNTAGPTPVSLPAGWDIVKGILVPRSSTVTSYAAGSAYSLTNVAAALVFGTTSPSLVLTAGTWLVLASVHLKANAATIVAETASVKLRRTNNTASDLTNGGRTISPPALTIISQTIGVISIPAQVYTTTNSDDAIAIFASVSATLGVGTIDAAHAEIVAIRLW